MGKGLLSNTLGLVERFQATVISMQQETFYVESTPKPACRISYMGPTSLDALQLYLQHGTMLLPEGPKYAKTRQVGFLY